MSFVDAGPGRAGRVPPYVGGGRESGKQPVRAEEGLTLEAAPRIVGLQDQLDTAHARIDELRTRHDVPPGAPHPTTASDDSAAGRDRTDVASGDRPPQR